MSFSVNPARFFKTTFPCCSFLALDTKGLLIAVTILAITRSNIKIDDTPEYNDAFAFKIEAGSNHSMNINKLFWGNCKNIVMLCMTYFSKVTRKREWMHDELVRFGICFFWLLSALYIWKWNMSDDESTRTYATALLNIFLRSG